MKKVPFSVRFLDTSGSFSAENPHATSGLYFPLCNEDGLLSSVTPSLHGDIKLDQHSFLTPPVSIDDLHITKTTRNFWVIMDSPAKQPGGQAAWSATGESAWQKALAPGSETVHYEAGFLWQKVDRTNKKLGLKASILSFVPFDGPTAEVFSVEITNISRKPIRVRGLSAIPLYARSADNLRDHRHVTSLLHRITTSEFGVHVCPTMSFNERGHRGNQTSYYVVGSNEGKGPVGYFPTLHQFIGEGGALDRPSAAFDGLKPVKSADETHQGQEAMGALAFSAQTLKPGQSTTFTFLLGIDPTGTKSGSDLKKFAGSNQVLESWIKTQAFWDQELSRLEFKTGDTKFNNWIRWVQLQPRLRKIFGCSFLPDFDYGRGGRGWRDLWQDCLALLLFDPAAVRAMIVHNFAGVRRDGSNATIIGSRLEFVADRNNISRTWMDHGTWPFLTTKLYLDQTGDWKILMEEAPYFPATDGNGTLLEHILTQHLAAFFNVGEHNTLRLEDADWNDGLDMAHQRGESVAFSHLYAANLDSIADMLQAFSKKTGIRTLSLDVSLMGLLDKAEGLGVDYEHVQAKRDRLSAFKSQAASGPKGEKKDIAIDRVLSDLKAKAVWMKAFLNRTEWVSVGSSRWMNGYYDNNGNKVEGKDIKGHVRMTLTGQVYPIMGGTVSEDGVEDIVQSVDQFLYDEKLGGYRLNTNFGETMPSLGRAFSFAYGEKENGAVFSHMVVMYANALYQRGFVEAGSKALFSLYRMAVNFQRSRIFPGIPEYFNNEARGRYHYLTGSASWYILTLLTQVFGVRGEGGDLRIAPKLSPEHFDRSGVASVTAPFAGCSVTVVVINKSKVPYAKMKIRSLQDEAGAAIAALSQSDKDVLIPRSYFTSHSARTLILTVN